MLDPSWMYLGMSCFVGLKWNTVVPLMPQVTSQKMHHPRQRADIRLTGSLRTTVGRRLTRHTVEVWSLIGGAVTCRMFLRG